MYRMALHTPTLLGQLLWVLLAFLSVVSTSIEIYKNVEGSNLLRNHTVPFVPQFSLLLSISVGACSQMAGWVRG